MIRTVFLISVIFFSPLVLLAQSPTWQMPTSVPASTDLVDIQFVDSLTGWAVGMDGTILKSIDGGQTWNSQYYESTLVLRDVFFLDSLHGWAIGRNNIPGFIARVFLTTNGGTSWFGRMASVEDAVHFVSVDTGFAVGYGGTIRISTDGGDTWTTQASLSASRLRCIYFIDRMHGWCAGDTGVIVRTDDGGGHWVQAPNPTTSDLRSIHFITPSVGWCVGFDGTILHSTDAGATWQPQESGTSAALYAVHALDQGTIVTAGDGGLVLKSTDGGISWRGQRTGTASAIKGISFSGSQRGFAAGNSGLILLTADGGGTADLSPATLDSPENGATGISYNPTLRWRKSAGATSYAAEVALDRYFTFGVQLIINVPDSTTSFSNLTGDTTYYWRAAAGYGGGPLVWSRSRTFRTTVSIPATPTCKTPDDDSRYLPRTLKFIWTRVKMASEYHFQINSYDNFTGTMYVDTTTADTSIVISGLPFSKYFFWRVLAKNEAGESPAPQSWNVWNFTTEGSTWRRIGYGSGVSSWECFSFPTVLTGYAGGIVNSKIYKTTDGGETWTSSRSPAVSNYATIYAIYFTDSLTGFCTPDESNIYKTIDGGNSWTVKYSDTIDAYTQRFVFTNPNQGWLMTSHKIFKTNDAGESWNVLYHTSEYLKDFDFIDSQNGWAIVGYVGDSAVIKTTDGGNTWTKHSANTTNGMKIRALTADNLLIVGSNDCIMKSIDGGVHWASSNSGTASVYPGFQSIGVVDSLTVYAGADNGCIFRSTDAGNTWTNTNVSVTNSGSIEDLKFFDGNTGLALTSGGGILKATNLLTSIARDPGSTGRIPDYFALDQNYPNPFNPSTTVRFSLPKSAFVTLNIYNTLGQRVATLVSQHMNAGSYMIDWNASGLASGVYFYRLEAGGFTATRKLLLLR